MPHNWPIVPLGEVLNRVGRFEPRDDFEKYQFAGTYSFGRGIFVGDLKTGSSFKLNKIQRIHAGDFVYCKIMAWEGAFGLVPPEAHNCVMSGAFVAYEIDEHNLEPKFLDYYFKIEHIWKKVGIQSTGTNIRRRSLHPNQFEAATVPLPPLDEQRHIVALIEELAAKVEQAQSLREKSVAEVEALQNSALRETFSRRDDKQSHLNKVTDIARGKFAFRPRNDPRFYNGDYPFIQIGDISNSNRYIRHYSQTLNEDGLEISRMFPKGTVVIAITGATIGATGILDFDSCFPDSIVGIVAHKDAIFSEYVYWSLEYVKNIALAEATQTTQPNINLRILNKLKIPFPSISEQRRIVAYLDNLQAKVEAVKRHQAATAAKLDALLPSILDRAFKGEL